jgi:hypothetical protein
MLIVSPSLLGGAAFAVSLGVAWLDLTPGKGALLMSVATIEDFLKAYNQTSKPLVWTATARQIADKIARCRVITRTEH